MTGRPPSRERLARERMKAERMKAQRRRNIVTPWVESYKEMRWFLMVLTLLFITLKLTHYIDWAWWRVLAPLWAPTALVIAVWLVWIGTLFVVFCLAQGLNVVLAALKRWRNR